MSKSARRSPWLRLLLPIIVLSLALGACGGSSQLLSTVGAPIGEEGVDYPAAGDPEAAAASEAPALPEEQPAGQLPDDRTGMAPSAPRDDLRIVYTGSLELVVDDLQASLAKARAAVLATGGYIGGSQERNDGDRAVATITYRIPATRWEDALEDLRGLAAKVVGEQTQATEVGSQIVDLEARIRNLRASEGVLVEIAKGTGKVTDLLEVQARISEVRGQIEQLDAQRLQLEDQAAYGTLVATFGTEVVQVQEAAKGWDPKTDVDGATATLLGAGQGLVSMGIWFGIVWLPLILVLVVIALVARWAIRRFMPKPRPTEPIAGWGGGSAS
jgi:hypothetical protein